MVLTGFDNNPLHYDHHFRSNAYSYDMKYSYCDRSLAS